jgi:hypothetical protein
MVIGHARHGKDRVCEFISKHYKLSYESSSHFAARKFIFDLTKDKYGYTTPEECLEDRVNHRTLWYNLISEYNSKYPARLIEELYEENDIYCGLRSKREFHCARNQGIIDYTIWVDRSDHKPPEPKESMNLEPWMADFVIDNNGSLAETEQRVKELMGFIIVRGYGYHAIDLIADDQ